MPSVQPAASNGTGGFDGDDFISFQFDDEQDQEHSRATTAEAGPSRPTSRRASPDRHGSRSGTNTPASSSRLPAPQSATSTGSRGKKRKLDDDERDTMTKKERERAAARGTPWSDDVAWDTANDAVHQLHREMMAFEKWLSPTAAEHRCRKMVIALIRNAIKSQWRDAEVHSFGSQDTELYLPQGDIDLVVVSTSMESRNRESVLRSMAACLRRNNLATEITVIARAKVPIIKFVCTHGRYRCDISVNQTNGLQAADFVNDVQDRMPAIRPLIMVTKHLLQQRGMSEVYSGGLGSFSVILLVVNFMQLHPKVQRGEIDPTRNLGILFLDFLELYGKNFSYDNAGISIRNGGAYFSKAHRGWKNQQQPFKLSIEDPQNPDNDISIGSYNIISVRSALSGAFDMLTSALCQRGMEMASGRRSAPGHSACSNLHTRFDDDPDEVARNALINGSTTTSGVHGGLERDPRSLLGNIIGVSRELIKSRKDIDKLYNSGILQRLLGRSPPGQSPSPGPSSRGDRRSQQSRRDDDRRQPREPSDSPPPLPASPPPPPPPPSSNRERNSGVARVIQVRGEAERRGLVPPQHSTPVKGTANRVSGLQRDTAITISSDTDETDDRDSRYAEHSRAQRQERERRQPKAYVSEESDDDDDDDSASEDEGEVSAIFRAGGVTNGSKGYGASSTSRRQNGGERRNYWLDKSGASLGSTDDELDN